MLPPYLFTSARLGFRTWKESDIQTLFDMCQDERVMEFFPIKPDINRVKKAVEGFNNSYNEDGYTYWAVDILSTGEFIGFIGLGHTNEVPDYSAVNIGWRLAHRYWGNGYATEGAKAVIDNGFTTHQLPEIMAFAVKSNYRSEAIMQKIGMSKIKEFNHPEMDSNHKFSKHILYSIKNTDKNEN